MTPESIEQLVAYAIELYEEDGVTVAPVTLVCCWTLDYPVVG